MLYEIISEPPPPSSLLQKAILVEALLYVSVNNQKYLILYAVYVSLFIPVYSIVVKRKISKY